MTTWILAIDEVNPQHWDIARSRGFWDITRRKAIRRGDLVYFWQSGSSLLGLVSATSDLYEIAPGTTLPWNVDDERRSHYRYRFDLDVIADEAAGDPGWTEVKDKTGIRAGLNLGPQEVPVEGEGWLWSQVLGTAEVPSEGEDALFDTLPELGDLSRDERVRLARMVATRVGQARFRTGLLETWRAQCVITGAQPTSVLEAAHIQPYRGEDAHVAGNGILLRADLHRLFDAHLITLVETDDGLVVRCSPELHGTDYEELDGRAVRAEPGNRSMSPHPESLAVHHKDCSWLRDDPSATIDG